MTLYREAEEGERGYGMVVVPIEEPVYKPTLCTSKWGHRSDKGNACKVKGCGAVWTERWLVPIGDTDAV